MAHEENGHVEHWTHRLVWCIHCKFDWEQTHAPDDDECPCCHYEKNYYVLETYYD